jgi:hypothetical protein
MIWARCRGGNLLRAAHAGFVQQESFPAALLVATTDPPDRGSVALQAVGYRLDRLTASNGQDDAGMFDLKEGQVSAACHGLQDRGVGGSNRQRERLPATHGVTSAAGTGPIPTIPLSANLLHNFVPGPLGQVYPRQRDMQGGQLGQCSRL